jgi:hypothetical protein
MRKTFTSATLAVVVVTEGLATAAAVMMEAVRTSETSVDNHFTRQYNSEDSSEQQQQYLY